LLGKALFMYCYCTLRLRLMETGTLVATLPLAGWLGVVLVVDSSWPGTGEETTATETGAGAGAGVGACGSTTVPAVAWDVPGPALAEAI
jgi:hypothetical protein